MGHRVGRVVEGESPAERGAASGVSGVDVLQRVLSGWPSGRRDVRNARLGCRRLASRLFGVVACLAVFSSSAFAQNLTELRFLPGGFTINGQPPAVLFERDAEQILNAQVSYEVEAGYSGGDHLFARVEPFGANPATLTSPAPGCATSTTSATVDVLLQNGAWTPSGARVGYSAAPFPLPDPLPLERPAPEARSFQFAFGVLCQDSKVEPTEQFRVTVWFQTGSVAAPNPALYPSLQYIVRIEDDDSVRVVEDVLITVAETDLDSTPRLRFPQDALPVPVGTGDPVCVAFAINAGLSTASVPPGASGDPVDARLSGSFVRYGFFVFSGGFSEPSPVTTDLVIVGDDRREDSETVVLDLYYDPVGFSSASCSVSAPTAVARVYAQMVVTIEDDDEDTSGISPTEFTVVETDLDAPAALALTFGAVADADYCFAFELAYGRSTAGAADAWVGAGKSSSGTFVLRAGLTEIIVRDLIIAGDDEVEGAETLFIDVFERRRGSSCSASGTVVTVLTVTIEDDDEDTSGISPTEFTVVETDVDAPAALALTFGAVADADYCFAFELAYGRSMAGAADAWVGAGKSSSGTFVLPAGLTEIIVRDFIIAGDDEVEGAETLFIDVFERRRGSSCSASGTVVTVLTVTIEDDDEDTSGISPTEFTVVETDVDAPAALALTFGAVADADYCFAFELAYGRSMAGAADAWVGAGKSSSGTFVLPAGLTEIIVRDFIIAGDDEVEGAEMLFIDVFERRRGSSCSVSGTVVTVLTVTIEDDDTDAPGIDAGALEVVETDVDAVALLQLTLGAVADETRCFPYRVAYGRSTATRQDAWLVNVSGDSSPAGYGHFVVHARSSTAVSLNLMVAGDDLVEGPETLHLDLYAPGPAGQADCQPTGAPTGTLVVTIVDDDIVVGIASMEVDGAVDGLIREGDSGERGSVHLLVTFERRLTEPVTLRFGSVADGLARGAAPKQDVETVAVRSATVAVGQIAVGLRVATVIGDDRVEAVEDFGVWVAVDDYGAETKTWLRVRIGNDDVAGDEILSVRLEGIEGAAIVEGNPDPGAGGGDCQREWKCVLLLLELTGGRLSEDITYEVHTVPGSARPGEDYRFRDGVRVTLEEGHLRSFNPADPLRIEVRRDWFVEGPREDFYLVVQMIAANETPLVSWFERLEIVDDDRIGGEDGALWFGGEHELDACPGGSRRFEMVEPFAGHAALVVLDLVVAQRPTAEGDDTGEASCEVGLGNAVTEYRYELRSASALVGVDVAVPADAGGRVRFVAGRGSLELAVVGDGALEPVEDLSLVLLGGGGPVARFTVVIQDRESAVEATASRTAEAVRMGRVLASEVSDVLAERFSCAASAACAALGADPAAQLWPGGASGPRIAPMALVRRLPWGSAPAGVSPGPFSVGADGGSLVAGGGEYGSPFGFGGGLGVPVRPFDRLVTVGRALDGVRYQGDPGRWLGAVNIARGDDRPGRWTVFTRFSYAEVEDVGNTARRLRTSMLTMTGGVDRQVGQVRVGVLYTHAAAAVETDAHGWAQETVEDPGRRPSAWRVVAPYAGWIPHRRFRLWVSPGWASGGEGGAALGEGLQASMTMLVGGASASVFASDELSVDVEADVFEVDVDRRATVTELAFRTPDAALSGRAQRARLAGRVGMPIGDPSTTASRLTLRLGRRWDVGADLDWVWGPIRPQASWSGAGQIAATDLLVDFRYRRLRSSLSLVATIGMQVGGEEPLVVGEHVRSPSRRRVGAAAGLQWGAAGSGAGWSASVRPSYGHVSLAMPGWWSAAVPGMSGFGAFELVPLLDGEVGYQFEDGGNVALSARQAFGGGRAGVGGIGALVRYGRGW